MSYPKVATKATCLKSLQIEHNEERIKAIKHVMQTGQIYKPLDVKHNFAYSADLL